MLPRIHAFFNADSLEIRFPELLKYLLIFIHQALVQHTRNQMSFPAVVIKRDRSHFLQIIVKAITPLHIIDNPLLIGKTIFEMLDSKRQSIILRFEGSKESTVRRFLKTHELHQMHPFAIHLLPYLGKQKHIRIAEVSLDRTGSVDRLTNITEDNYPYIGQFRQPTLGEAAKRGRRDFLLQATPHAGGFLFIGDHRMQFIIKQRQSIPFRQQEIGKGLTKISVEDSSQQTIKSFIVDIDVHYLAVYNI